MSKSPTITNNDRVHNSHAGELLMTEFMEPLELDIAALSTILGVDELHLSAIIEGKQPFDAELDLRLSRYFGMSEGFFLGLQIDYELLEAKRSLNGDLERIVPRAA